MRAVIVCTSVHHGNTERVARAMARELGAEVVSTREATVEAVTAADLVGFGSGIYYGRHHRNLLAFAESLPEVPGKRAFVFSTSGANGSGFHRKLDEILQRKGYAIAGEFSCPGWDTWAFLRLTGGINRGRPDEADLADAAAFARGLVA